MNDLVVVTYDWVPEKPRGFVRDLRIRWALEEAGLPYRVESTPFKDRGAEHFAHQPFGQAPWLMDGDLSIFESGAILLHLGEKSEKLMPKDTKGRSDVIEWVFAALNSVEAASQHWTLMHFFGAVDEFNHRMAEMPQYDHIILSMRGMPSVDVSGAQAMLELCESLKSQGKTVACCGMTEAVRTYFDRAGITELLGEESYFWSADQAILDLLDAEIVE